MKRHLSVAIIFTLLAGFVLNPSSSAVAQAAGVSTITECQNGVKFESWLEGLKTEALQKGVSQKTWNSALPHLTYNAQVIKNDRSQKGLQKTFVEFANHRAAAGFLQKAQSEIKKNEPLLAKITKDFGVPPQVLVTLWGLESDFSASTGNFSILSATATLAYDCRRSDFFRTQVLAALLIIEKGDLSVDEMVGNWAGEIGGTQLTPVDYLKYAIDYDGDGRTDLIHSVPDTLATAANFLKGHGWQAGEPWLQEATISQKSFGQMPWQEADLAISHPLAQWIQWGVGPRIGEFPKKNYDTSLILPMGRFGPVFVAYPNFQAFLGWNSSLVYTTTAAYIADRLNGTPAFKVSENAPDPLNQGQIVELQNLLNKKGYAVGEADGKLGAGTRTAVKQFQLKVGLPADSYPSAELLEKLSE
jgi:lytic murein transglycosylase